MQEKFKESVFKELLEIDREPSEYALESRRYRVGKKSWDELGDRIEQEFNTRGKVIELNEERLAYEYFMISAFEAYGYAEWISKAVTDGRDSKNEEVQRALNLLDFAELSLKRGKNICHRLYDGGAAKFLLSLIKPIREKLGCFMEFDDPRVASVVYKLTVKRRDAARAKDDFRSKFIGECLYGLLARFNKKDE